MIPLRRIIEQERKRLNVPWIVLEQDYLLSWILWGIGSVDKLKDNLIFKGGTALKKTYFGDYRFSEDLDFSAMPTSPWGEELEKYILQACLNAQNEMSRNIPDPIIDCKRYVEKVPHPEGQEAFTIRAQLPWHRSPQVRVMIEITKNEKIILDPLLKPIKHDYGESFDCTLNVYPLEEIIAEKLRAMLQNIKKYHERGWSRSRARDYYDIWCILRKYENDLNLEKVPDTLVKKCEDKGVSHTNHMDFFNPIIIDQVQKDWDQWLAPLISDLPQCDKVLADLEINLSKIIPSKGKLISS